MTPCTQEDKIIEIQNKLDILESANTAQNRSIDNMAHEVGNLTIRLDVLINILIKAAYLLASFVGISVIGILSYMVRQDRQGYYTRLMILNQLLHRLHRYQSSVEVLS